MNQGKIGAFIAMLRKEKGYTQKEVANRLDLSEKNNLKMGMRQRAAGSSLYGTALQPAWNICE